MKQTKQGVRSTKVLDEDAMLDSAPSPGVKHKDVYLRMLDGTKKAMYTNQTGKSPITSAQGNNYIMVAVENQSSQERQRHSLMNTRQSSNNGRPLEQ
jgi:hypothetical protein